MPVPRSVHRLAAWLRRHAAEDRNSITLTIAPSQAERTFQLELPRWSLRFLGLILASALVLVLVGGVLYGKLIRDSVLLRQIRDENMVLRERAARLDQIEANLREIDRVRRQLLSLAGMEEEGNASSWTGDRGDSLLILAEPLGDSQEGTLSPQTRGTPLRQIPLRGPVSRGHTAGRGGRPKHSGVDIAGMAGAPVAAAADGRVAMAGWDETFGKLLVLRHRDGWETRYGHNDGIVVSVGDSVEAGQTIALVGSTGRSSAPHLHFEVLKDGRPVDPGEYFLPYVGGD